MSKLQASLFLQNEFGKWAKIAWNRENFEAEVYAFETSRVWNSGLLRNIIEFVCFENVIDEFSDNKASIKRFKHLNST